MRRTFCILSLSLFLFCSSSFAQSYDKMWKTLSEYQKKDLPQSVVKQAYKIFNKAQQENNSPQIIKSFLTAMQYREIISSDSLAVDVASLEKLANNAKKIEEKALLYTILAKVKSDSNPQKSLEYVRMAMRDADKIADSDNNVYKPLIEDGNFSSRYFKNNLLHLISMANLDTVDKINDSSSLKKKILSGVLSLKDFENSKIVSSLKKGYTEEYLSIYQTLLWEYNRKGMAEAWVITASDILNVLGDYSKEYNDSIASDNLRKLADEYAKNEAAAYTYSLLVDRECQKQEYATALDIIHKCISKYPKYIGIKSFKNKEKAILTPSMSASINDVFSGVKNKLNVRYCNVSSLKMNLYKINSPISALQLYNDNNLSKNITKHISLIRSEKYSLTQYNDHKLHSEEVGINIDKPGLYYVELVSDKGVKDGKIMNVTSFIPLIHTLPGKKIKIVVLDASSGKPASDACFNIYTKTADNSKYGLSESLKTNPKGEILIDSNKKIDKYNITDADDNGMRLTNFSSSSYRSYTDYKKEKVTILTDRSIYKPAQTVNFSGFAYTHNDDSTKVLPMKEYEAALIDANYTTVSTMNVTTDKFGAFHGSFVLPSNSLNGEYRIKIISCQTSFMVEEYKRPTFTVEFQPVEESFSIGDTVNVVGCAKTYWGQPVKNALVKCKISNRGFGRFYLGRREVIQEKVLQTNEDGCFSLPVAITNYDDKAIRYWYRSYEINATVTDNSGESVEAGTSINYGSSSLTIDVHGLNDIVLKENNDSVIYKVKNLAGKDIDTQVLLKLYKFEYEGKDSVLVLDNEVTSNISVPMKWPNGLPSGKYKLVLSCTDDSNRETQLSKTFTMFSLDDKRPPVKSDFWIYNSDNGKQFISFGTSKSDVDIYFNILAKDKVIDSKMYTLSDGIVNVDCSYKKEYGDGVNINIAFVKDGKLHTYSKNIIKPYPQKQLVLKWETFRDKLQPGKNEEWRLKITYPDGKPAHAQLISTMYDASLDAIYKHGWNFYINYTRDVNRYPYSYIIGESASFNLDENSYYEPYQLEYSRFNLPYLDMRRIYNSPLFMEGAVMDRVMMSTNKVMSAPNMHFSKGEMMIGNSSKKVDLRKDFSETAFFYPQLNTDKNGVVKIAFSLPESLTKWHFIGFAHTEDVNYGIIESDVTASKEFMVKPSLPRFLRAGDKCYIPISVTNLKDKDMKGDLSIEMIDPMTNKTIYSSQQKIDVDEGETSNYQFEYIVPQDYSLLICRIIGKGKNFSDGEQNYISLLSDKEMATESTPMIMNDKGKYNFNISPSKDKKVTVEVTANPIWHVVQSLPIMLTPRDDAAYSWASSLYASIVNEYLLDKNPAIRNLSSLYKSSPETAPKNMIESELQKNKELKDIVLSETPWVAEANKEERQRKMLSQLGDVNAVKYSKQKAIEHLRSLQNSDGSWIWYKNMAGNISITTDVLQALTRAKVMTGTTFEPQLNGMCLSAFNYLKKEAEKSYQQDVKYDKEGRRVQYVPQWIMKYIYLSAIDPAFIGNDKVSQYYVGKLKDSAPSLDIYEKSLCAVIFNKMNMKQEANLFLQSLLEYTVYNKNMGRYFDTKKARCTYTSNIIPSVVSTIEALQLSRQSSSHVDQMKQWLIAMKGVQGWSTNMATTNAIYALLNNEKLSNDISENGYIKINVGKDTYKIAQNEPLGYIKKEVGNGANNVNIEKTYPGLSYGAIYQQGLVNIDTLKQSSTGLSINKTLYRNGERVGANTILNIGDVIKVQLVIDSPAYMDFVQIKDPMYSCMQPCEQLSSVRWDNGMSYNRQIKNASVNFFIDKLGKGRHTIEYNVFITKKGLFRPGLTTAESAYFPMLRSFASGSSIHVE